MKNELLDDLFHGLASEDKEPDTCKGVFFRYTENNYVSGDRITLSKQLRMLKRISCPGCRECGWIMDDAHEGIVNNQHYVMLDNDLDHGDIVTLNVVVDSTDWETGYADGWHLEARKWRT